MRKSSLFFIVVLSVLLAGCRKADKSIVIFFDNDVHCAVDGYPYFAGLRSAVDQDTAYVAMVSSGDYIQGGTIGSISRGEAIMSIIKEIGYDAMAMGNHEFDYDVQHIQNLAGDTDAPLVCANLVDNEGKNVFAPYRICQYGNRKVGYIGVTTPNTYLSKPAAFQDLQGNVLYDFHRFDLYEHIQKTVDEVRKQADYVIVLSHLGEDPDSIGITSHKLIAATHGIDALMDAHTHSYVTPRQIKNDKGEGVWLAQTGDLFNNAGKLVIGKDGTLSMELVKIFANKDGMDNCPVDAHIKQYVDSIVAYYSQITEMPVGQCDFDLVIEDELGNNIVRVKDTNAGNLVTDAMREFAQTDIAFTNGGGIRNSVKAGNLKRGDIIAMLPYENNVCSFTITGQQLQSVLEASVKPLPALNGSFLQISGMEMEVRVLADKDNEVSNIKVLNQKTQKYEPIKMDGTYSVAVTDYLLINENFNVMDKNFPDLVNHHVLSSDVVIDFINNICNGKVPGKYANAETRIKFK